MAFELKYVNNAFLCQYETFPRCSFVIFGYAQYLSCTYEFLLHCPLFIANAPTKIIKK